LRRSKSRKTEAKNENGFSAATETRAALLVVSSLLLGYALQRSHGHYHASSLAITVGSYLLAALALWLPELNVYFLRGRLAAFLVLFGICLQAAQLLTSPPTIEIGARSLFETRLFDFLMATVPILALAGVPWASYFRRFGFPLAVLFHFIAGILVIRWVPIPHIDTFSMAVESLQALFKGINPFAILITDIYEGKYPFFPPGFVADGKLLLGYAYPPLSLLLSIPGWVIGGDPRYSTLIAMEVAAVLIGYSVWGNWAKWVALLFLFTPRTFFVVDRAWNDPFIVMAMAAAVFVAGRWPKYLFVPAGLYLSMKQHVFFGAPALLLLLPKPWRFKSVLLFFAKAAAVALVPVIPFFLWSPEAFTRSVLTVREVFRLDSLSLLSHWANIGGAQWSTYTGVAVALPVMLLGVWKAPRSAFGFALVTAVTHFTLYLFSTHSFCNQYYVVLGASMLAAALVPEKRR
jgi:hypothetical protein